MESIAGVWNLLSFEVLRNGRDPSRPFGEQVNGLVIYQSNGYMSGMISGEGRPDVSSTATAGLSEEERAALSKNFIAYAGTYRLRGDEIEHNIRVSFIPNLMHEESHRNSFSLKDGRLITVSEPQSLQNKGITIVLDWEKVR